MKLNLSKVVHSMLQTSSETSMDHRLQYVSQHIYVSQITSCTICYRLHAFTVGEFLTAADAGR